MTVIECQGFKLGEFGIPSFTLKRGELLCLCLYGGGHFFELETKLVDIFTGKTKHPGVIIRDSIEFANHIHPEGLRQKFFPTTVKQYMAQNAEESRLELPGFVNSNELFKSRLRDLPGSTGRALSISCVLSKSNGIVFDFVGVDPTGAESILEFVKNKIQVNNGFGILLENTTELKESSIKYLEVTHPLVHALRTG